jgi:hypothetical protein
MRTCGTTRAHITGSRIVRSVRVAAVMDFGVSPRVCPEGLSIATRYHCCVHETVVCGTMANSIGTGPPAMPKEHGGQSPPFYRFVLLRMGYILAMLGTRKRVPLVRASWITLSGIAIGIRLLANQDGFAADSAPTMMTNDGANPSALSTASKGPPFSLDPMIVTGSKPPGLLGKVFGYSWNVSEAWKSNFHIRNGQLVDAIGFRHVYLQKHPEERAIVVVVTRPPDPRVTQAIVAYTLGRVLHLESVAMGDIAPGDLSAADIDHPDTIKKYVQSIRETYTMELASPTHYDFDDLNRGIGDTSGIQTTLLQNSTPADRQKAAQQSAVAIGMSMAFMHDSSPFGFKIAAAEETGDYSNVAMGNRVLYPGSPDDMLTSAYYWLNDEGQVGLIPVSRGKVSLDLSQVDSGRDQKIRFVTQDAVVFDWDGVHYMYNDHFGTLGMALPKNPITGAPYLVLKNGALLESIYFVATYSKCRPAERAALVPSPNGIHAAAVFTQDGQVWMMSPFLGRFALPGRFRIDQIGTIAKLHETLIGRELKKFPSSTASLPVTGLPQAMPGDSPMEQVRRAYLAFAELGLPTKFLKNERGAPGLQVSYGGSEYSYLAPE